MEKIFETLCRNFKYYFLHFLFLPILVSLVLYFIILIVKYKKMEGETSFSDSLKENIINRKNLLVIVPILYSFILYHATVTNRIITNQRFEPLSDIFGGWKIVELQYFYDFSPVWNVVMFLPMAFITSVSLRYIKNIEFSNLKITTISSLFSFILSLLIEISQIIFHAGTFQFSDLFYNTLGGFVGALIYILIINICKKSTKR